jgi:hypothetical protein
MLHDARLDSTGQADSIVFMVLPVPTIHYPGSAQFSQSSHGEEAKKEEERKRREIFKHETRARATHFPRLISHVPWPLIHK